MSKAKEFVDRLMSYQLPAQGVAVRDRQGGIRPLNFEEKQQIGLDCVEDFSALIGQEIIHPHTGMRLVVTRRATH